ncbi:NUZM, NADH-ubiquinone oxidoreductase 21.3 kDa subunit [Athelia psychrophila]|uniref:NUZM, NADH-ubiquinone oxidoreductase 21.3 kDa subunit n=1 Tax=Athelia psychrophila TaxID=1759441 RepID=A0A166X708_9AGAM|nr:NUZM, NADH-ubiquinone oxidoreductase 21.3 kDa subunit [Fibularhizoctonia sp. CBS 109695]
MATKRAAESTLYHVHPTGFWKKFRDAVVVNPELSSGLPIPTMNRYPQPASRPERYSSPATKASDPVQNPYWKRDVRRAYPQLSMVTQSELSQLLLQHSRAPAVAPPTEVKEGDKPSPPVAAALPEAVELTTAISEITGANKVYSSSKLPPRIPSPFKRWTPDLAEDAPHDPNAYFPMLMYK